MAQTNPPPRRPAAGQAQQQRQQQQQLQPHPATPSSSASASTEARHGQEQTDQEQTGSGSTASPAANFAALGSMIAVNFFRAVASECMETLGLSGKQLSDVLRDLADDLEGPPL